MAALFVDHLTVIDCSYLHPLRGLLGESWIVDLELYGDLDEQGMVFDFGQVKRTVKQAIDELTDHKLVLPAQLEDLEITEEGETLRAQWSNEHDYRFLCRAPHNAFFLLEEAEVSLKAMQNALQLALTEALPDNVKETRLRLRYETTKGPYYQYSHGLKKHQGDCQRIAHGHRSRLEIYENGSRSQQWESYWSRRWEDIYIATQEDLTEELEWEDIPCMKFCYQAQQGDFELVLPQQHCYLISSDSTVEHIAQHIANECKQQKPGSQFMVRAFEGVDKGALAWA